MHNVKKKRECILKLTLKLQGKNKIRFHNAGHSIIKLAWTLQYINAVCNKERAYRLVHEIKVVKTKCKVKTLIRSWIEEGSGSKRPLGKIWI